MKRFLLFCLKKKKPENDQNKGIFSTKKKITKRKIKKKKQIN